MECERLRVRCLRAVKVGSVGANLGHCSSISQCPGGRLRGLNWRGPAVLGEARLRNLLQSTVWAVSRETGGPFLMGAIYLSLCCSLPPLRPTLQRDQPRGVTSTTRFRRTPRPPRHRWRPACAPTALAIRETHRSGSAPIGTRRPLSPAGWRLEAAGN